MKAWFFSLRKSRQIALAVLFLHFAALAWMAIDHVLSQQPVHRPLTVRTIRPPVVAAAPPKPPPAPAKKQAAAKQQTAPAAPLPPAKKKAKPAALPAPPSAPVASPAASAPPPAALRHIEESFAALEAPPTLKAGPDLKLPALLEKKSAVALDALESVHYGQCLIQVIQSALQLPETGSVRARLVVASPGRIASIDILDARSAKNADWLKNQLPLLELPCFNDFHIAEATLEFTITFRNDETS